MKITDKGQVTIPAALSKKHGFAPGAAVKFIDQPNGVLIVKAARFSKGRHVVDTLLRGGAIKGRTEDWLTATRGKDR